MVATVTRLQAAAMRVLYFEADGYYARNDPEHRKASRWYGEAAASRACTGRSSRSASRRSWPATCPAPIFASAVSATASTSTAPVWT